MLAWVGMMRAFTIHSFLSTFLFFASFLSLGISSAFAADYVWSARFDNFPRTGSSPSAACSASIAAANAYYNITNSLAGVTRVTDTQFTCKWADRNGYSGPTYAFSALRTGDSCPTGADYDQQTGTCDVDPDIARCKALEGTSANAITTGNSNDPNSTVGFGADGKHYYSKQRTYNLDGCVADIGLATSGGGKCVHKPDGSYACRFPVGYTGEASVEGEGTDAENTNSDPQPEKTSDSDQECSSWSASQNGTRTKSCTSTSNASQDGSSTCSRGDYNMTCHNPKPTPESDSNTRTDDISETTNGDGGKTTTTNSTETNTYCNSGSCNTTTTTSTTTTTTNSDGEVTDQTTECSGPKCPGVEEDGEGEEEGDGEFEGPGGDGLGDGSGDGSGALPIIGSPDDKKYSEATEEYMERITNSPFVSSITNISVPHGGSCSIGSASLFGGSVNFNHFCTMAPDVLGTLRYIFLAIWAWSAIRLLFTA